MWRDPSIVRRTRCCAEARKSRSAASAETLSAGRWKPADALATGLLDACFSRPAPAPKHPPRAELVAQRPTGSRLAHAGPHRGVPRPSPPGCGGIRAVTLPHLALRGCRLYRDTKGSRGIRSRTGRASERTNARKRRRRAEGAAHGGVRGARDGAADQRMHISRATRVCLGHPHASSAEVGVLRKPLPLADSSLWRACFRVV